IIFSVLSVFLALPFVQQLFTSKSSAAESELVQTINLASIALLREKPDLTSSLNHPGSVFLFNQQLTDPKEFYGRLGERQQLIKRIRNRAPASIVGSSKVGTSWLIRYLMLVAKDELGPNFRVGFLDA